MTHRIFWILALTLLSGTLAVQEDCEVPPTVDFATVRIEDEEDSVRAIYACNSGYTLEGETELICDLDSDEWNGDPPTCVKIKAEDDDGDNEEDNDIEETNSQQQQKKKKIQDIPEDPYVTAEYAASLDMSCVSARVKAPEIQNGFVHKYDRRRIGESIFFVAFYSCNDNFELEDSERAVVYCSQKKWIGQLPSCISLGDYNEEDYDGYDEAGEDEDIEEEEEKPPVVLQPSPETETSTEVQYNIKVSEEDRSEVTTTPEPVTDINIVVQPTKDPYTPRVLNQSCGPEKGGCDHNCEMVLYPGENEPRVVCSCYSGFTLDPYDYRRCHDINECDINNGGCEQICNNIPGSYECTCQEGLQINTVTGNTCVDINECLLRNGHGPCQDTCHNTWGTYTCSCDGLPGTKLSADRISCEDDGECAINNGGCSHICLTTLGRVFCLCPSGFILSKDWKNCQDINECESPEMAERCPGGCENTAGSYICHEHQTEETRNREEESKTESEPQTTPASPQHTLVCEEGFRLSSDGNCVDIDECAEGIARCENCRNTHGSYDCTCPSGYELSEDETTCVDINECEAYSTEDEEEEGQTPYRLCSHECENTQGSFICKCAENFHIDDDKRTCVQDTCQDRNNPELNKIRCSYTCEDSADGPVCKCPDQYQLAEDKFTCVPTPSAPDACEELGGRERCLPGSCLNSDDGRYKCVCPAGFNDEVYFCKDIDECAIGTHNCSHTCFNTDGSFVCSCPIGFRTVNGDVSRCEDIDECVENEDACGDKVCRNTEGGFSCICTDGREPNENGECESSDLCSNNNGGCSHDCLTYEGRVLCRCPPELTLSSDGYTCIHQDVCANNNNGCSQICNSQLQGSCSCELGYELQEDGRSCRDYDECIDNNGGCEHICVNNPGSFSCACESGFELKEDLRTCTDVDECTQSLHDCSHYCVNVVGGYECSCPAGFVLGPNKLTCSDVDECAGYSSCSHTCRNSLGSFECECPAGLVLDVDKRTCIDGDFCKRLQPQCSHICENVGEGFQCGCPAGLTLGSDSLTCVDINECVIDNGGCSHTCTNTEGSFSCVCPYGSRLEEDGKTCQDVNECDVDNGGCAHYCINTKGGHTCECSEGYALQDDGFGCIESDPCRRNNGGCEHICVAAGLGVKCACRLGYILNPSDNSSCVDIDECQFQDTCPSQSCRNTPGSFECTCGQGFAKNSYGQCVDINECDYQNGGCAGECVNLPGSFECKCARGLRLSNDRKSCVQPRDQCQPFRPPKHGEIHCTRSRHKTQLYYKTKCSVWCVQGYKLEGPSVRHCNPSGQWDNFENKCVPQLCPALPRAEYGTILPANCLLGKTQVGERCLLHCQHGYVPAGKKVAVCLPDQRWSYNSTFDCIPYGAPILNSSPLEGVHHRFSSVLQTSDVRGPYIKCPRNTTVLLPSGQKTVHIVLQKPKTNLDYRYVESFPAWTRNLQAHLGAGIHVIRFRGRDPITRRGAGCRTVITVKSNEPPKVAFCPPSFEVSLSTNQERRSIVWKEPQFQSESEIKSIYKSNIPGQLFGEGVHRISYEATDVDGLTARCEFNVVVKASPPPLLPSLPYTYNYPSSQDRSAKLLANHDSYIICNGQAPVKLFGNQPINLPPGCVIKNVRVNPVRQYLRRRLITHRWMPFRSF